MDALLGRAVRWGLTVRCGITGLIKICTFAQTFNNEFMKTIPSGDRIVFVDYIRVVACFLVMLVHASENFYAADASGLAGNVSLLANESNRFWVAFYDGFYGRISVPLFMIVSAFLLVPMKSGVTMGDFYKRRLDRKSVV